ncbi:MAG: MFS transporter [Roseobacter sp.]
MTGALSNPTYRRLLFAQVFSVVGSGLTTIALALLAFEMAAGNAGVVLGTALALKMVAYVGLAPVGAAIAARLPRKPFLIGLDLARVFLVLLLPFVSEIWQIYVLVFAFQACSAAFSPTFQATIPDILEDENDYAQALSYSRLAYDLESLLVPVLAGALLVFTTFHVLFVGTGIGFLLSAALVASVTLPSQNAVAGQLSFRKRVTRGAWIYLATPRLRGMLALYVAVAAATAMIIVNTVVFVKSTLGLGDDAVALYLMASGFGSMLVALILPKVLRRISPRPLMLAGAGIVVCGLIFAAFGPGYVSGLFVWAALGAGAGLIQTPSGLILTRSCTKTDRPAVFAAQFALSHSAWLLAYPLAGTFGAWLGLSATFGIMALLAACGLLLALRLWPAEDPVELEHAHESENHAHAFGDHLHHEGDAVMAERPKSHQHKALRHSHPFVIDDHHPVWPSKP